jgi:hypothetical protein
MCDARIRAALQPSALGRGDPNGDLRLPRREANLHIACREAEFDDAHVHAEANSSDERVLQKRSNFKAALALHFRLVQLLP